MRYWAVLFSFFLGGALGASPGESGLTIFFTGSVQGNYGPCGCNYKPSGGLARRAGYLDGYQSGQAGATINLDAGNYFMPLGPGAQEANQLMLEGLQRLPVEVVNLASEDLLTWKHLASQIPAGTDVITTNLIPKTEATPAPKKHAILTLSASQLGINRGLRIGVLGVTDPDRVKPRAPFRVLDPLEAVNREMKTLQSQVDFVVLLADFPRGETELPADSPVRRIVQSQDQIYAVIFTEKRFALFEPQQINNAVVLSAVERGRYLGQLRFTFSSDGEVQDAVPEFIELGPDLPEDPYFLERQKSLTTLLPQP